MTTMAQDRPLVAPVQYPDSVPFWEAANAGKLLVRWCNDCGKPHWYPRPLCPFCLGETQWRDSPGTGEIYSVSVTRRAGPIAYAIAYVRLDEGVTMLTNIVECDLDSLRIGDRVQVVFKPTTDGPSVPMFRPA